MTLDYQISLHGATIRHALDNTKAEAQFPDGEKHSFEASQDEPNATLQAIQWAKAERPKVEAARLEARKQKQADAQRQTAAAVVTKKQPPTERGET